MTSAPPRYEHRQEAKWHIILVVMSIVLLCSAWPLRSYGPVAVAGVWLLFALAIRFVFRFMVVRDEGTHLAISFGPIPLIRRRIAYDEITSVEPCRSSLIDGWGDHWLPSRGRIYNLWGFDCVKLRLGKKIIRIGSDDVAALVGFLKQTIKPPEEHP